MAQQRRTRVDGRESIELIKAHARNELAEHGAVNFNLDRILEVSGVSRGSVYHHFGSRNGLLAVVSLEESLARMLDELKAIEKLALAATTQEQMRDVLLLGFTITTTPETKERRLRRVSGFAAVDGQPIIRNAMKQSQIEGTNEFIRILEEAAQRGLIQPTASIRGIAYLMQSMLLGRVMADIVDSEEIDNEWLEASKVAVRSLLGI